MALGTYAGGWRIINTLGKRIVKIDPPEGFAAQTSTATILGFTAHFGFPVSTTHTVSSSILGAGLASRKEAVQWRIARQILAAWLITIPCAALLGGALEAALRLPGGVSIILVLAGTMAASIFLTRNWTQESLAQLRSRTSFLRRRRALAGTPTKE
jgi:PiT family inorganic phosphate transporter